MIRKLLTALVLLLAAHVGMSAATYLLIHRTDGKNVSFKLAEKPVVTFDASDLLVAIDGNELAIARADIESMEFSDEDGLKALPADFETTVEIIDGNTVRFRLPVDAAVNVCDLSGLNASQASVLRYGDCVTVSVADCPAGVYVITCNNQSFKIIRK